MTETIGHEAVFKAIPGYEGYYSATTDGRIYKHPRGNRKGGFINNDRKMDYIRVSLSKNGDTDWEYVHRLIAFTFCTNPNNKPQVNHKNMDKHDNRVENLEWVTWEENWNHARDHGRYRGKMLSQDEKLELCKFYSTGIYTEKQLADHFGISKGSVYRHIRNHRSLQAAA